MYNPDASPDRGGGTPSHSRGDRLTPDRFAALYREHHRTLWYIAASVHGDRTHAHDVVQEAAMIAMSKLADFDPATSFTAWMGQIVRFVALNEGRKLQRTRARGSGGNPANDESHYEPIPFTLNASSLHPSLVPSLADFDQSVASAIAMLDEKARACLLLRTVQGLSYAAISTTLAMPEGTVMSHVHRAKAQLREQLARHDLSTRAPDSGRAPPSKGVSA